MDRESDNDPTRSHVMLVKGTLVAHYRIVVKIGAGGMGEVYLAEEIKFGRKAAIRFPSDYLSQDEDSRILFKWEAQAAALG